MKRILSLLIVSACCSIAAHAQCVVYACERTGAWGSGYNQQNDNITLDQCEERARAACEANGGIDCKVLAKSTKGGWWSVISTRRPNSPVNFDMAQDKNTLAEAEKTAKDKYKAHGGSNPNVQIQSWFAYAPKAAASPKPAKAGKHAAKKPAGK